MYVHSIKLVKEKQVNFFLAEAKTLFNKTKYYRTMCFSRGNIQMILYQISHYNM